MRYLILLTMSLLVPLLLSAQSSGAVLRAEAPPPADLQEGEFFFMTIDEPTGDAPVHPRCISVRMTNSESGEWAIELPEANSETNVVPVVLGERGVHFEIVHPRGDVFIKTIYTARVRNPELIDGRYYRIAANGIEAREGRFTLQKKK